MNRIDIFYSTVGWIKGDPNRLLYSVDSNGRLCGRDAAVQSVNEHFLTTSSSLILSSFQRSSFFVVL